MAKETENAVHVYIFLTDTKYYVPIKLLSTTMQSQRFHSQWNHTGKPDTHYLTLDLGHHWRLTGLQSY